MRPEDACASELEAYFSGKLEAAASGLSSAWHPIVVRALTGATTSVRDYTPLTNDGALATHNRIKATLGRCVGRRTPAVLRARYTPAKWDRHPELVEHFGALVGLVVWLAQTDRGLYERDIVRAVADSDKRGPGRTLKSELHVSAKLELTNALMDYRASAPKRHRAA